MKYFKNTYLNPDDELKILDIGSFDRDGNYNYGLILDEEKWTYNGLDLKAGNNVDIVVKNPYNWREIKAKSYDVVISGQAFEHIEFFWLTLEQINRVLKPGGLFCLIVPSTGPEHKNPYDCYRFYEDGMRAMAKYIHLEVLETGTNSEDHTNPWHDSHLIARKPKHKQIDKSKSNLKKIKHKMKTVMGKLDI